MKNLIAILLCVSIMLIAAACSSKPSDGQAADYQVPVTSQAQGTSINEEPSAEQSTEPDVTDKTEQSKEDKPMKQAQFYITAQGITFTADFAESDSADALRELLGDGDLTISMSDYGSFEKVGSIGKSLSCKDTQISTTAGDIMLYQGNQIVIFYGENSWSYSRLGRIEDVSADDLLSAFGNGDIDVTFSLTMPQ